MCSNHIWPLLWLRALSRSLWPNYPVSIRSRQALQACLGNAWTRMWTFEYHRFTEWERQRHYVVLACVVAWFGNFAWMKKFVFFLHGRKLVLLPQRDVTMTVDFGSRSRDSRDDAWNLFATMWQFLKFGTLLRRSWWNLLSLNAGWWYSRGASA